MTLDHDGKIRMDCSSPYAMAGLVKLKDQFQVAFGNDPDADRHGIVTPSAGLMNPNHYLAVAIHYLLTHRPQWPATAAVGKTLVSSSMIDRVVAQARPQAVGGAGRLQVVRRRPVRRLVLLRRRGERRRELPPHRRHGLDDRQGRPDPRPARRRDHRPHRQGPRPALRRADAANSAPRTTPASTPPRRPQQKAAFKKLTPEAVTATTLAGEPITAKLTSAPGNNASIGGLKITTANGWFAARPSGTENIYKIYAESFRDAAHLKAIVAEAQQIVTNALADERRRLSNPAPAPR